MSQIQRRQLLLCASALLFSRMAQGQRPERVRSIAVLMGNAESDPEGQVRLAAFKEHLAALGWKEGHNVRTTVGWTASDVDRASALARELVALKPDVILASTTPVTVALQRETRTIPIVFTVVSDPIGSGLVESLAHPGGNITGLVNVEASLAGKWLELLREIVPRLVRVAAIFNPQTAPYAEYYLRPLKAIAPKFGVTIFTPPVRSESDIEEVVTGLGRGRDNGLIVMTDSFLTVHRKSIITLTARNRVPAVYSSSAMPAEGGLISYGPDGPDLFRRAAPFVDRILRGRNPNDLPVEQPTKFELAVNLKTAKALGIVIPQSVLLRADKVIE